MKIRHFIPATQPSADFHIGQPWSADFHIGGEPRSADFHIGTDHCARSRRAGFTMVEVALALGVMAFALVAIIGVLPSGMKVQRENREDTIINQDLSYVLEAIRSGARGVDDLTNYVESITIKRGLQATTYTNNVRKPGRFEPLTNGQHIVALLSGALLKRHRYVGCGTPDAAMVNVALWPM